MQITTIGIDLAKTVFQIHAVDADGATVIRKRLRRAEVLSVREASARLRRGVRSLSRRPGCWDVPFARWRLAAKQALNHDIEHRHHQQCQDHDGDHAAHHSRAKRILTHGTRARSDHHRRDAEHESKASHQDRPEAKI
jgi:hypothetical protein